MQLKILTFLQSPFIKSSIARKVAPCFSQTTPPQMPKILTKSICPSDKEPNRRHRSAHNSILPLQKAYRRRLHTYKIGFIQQTKRKNRPIKTRVPAPKSPIQGAPPGRIFGRDLGLLPKSPGGHAHRTFEQIAHVFHVIETCKLGDLL